MTKLYEERKKKHLCVRCGKKPVKNRTLCRVCALAHEPSRTRRIEKRKRLGLCTHCEDKAIRNKTLCKACNIKQAEDTRRSYQKIKAIVLSYYGKDGKLQCNWPECSITDIDMLSLDHINDNGAEERRKTKCKGCSYRRVLKSGLPSGFQTLCFNHQWKKQMIRLRKISLDKLNKLC